MSGSWRLFLGAMITGVVASAVGCPYMPEADAKRFGQDGGMTGTRGAGGSIPCSIMSPCEDVDKNPCTKEACTNGFCASTLLTQMIGPGSTECRTIVCASGVASVKNQEGEPCGVGLLCDKQGRCAGCMNAGQCGPTDECQTPTCLPDTTCEYDYQPLGTHVTTAKLPNDMPGDCKATLCNGFGLRELFADDMDVPQGVVDCTDKFCADGTVVEKPSAVGTSCAGGLTFCNASQVCKECVADANCAMGQTCYQEHGCVSCTDGIENGGETDIDCGGPCNACGDQKGCSQKKDCVSLRCENGTCVSCSDGVKDGDEVGVDCGGTVCFACPGAPCMVADTCALNHCVEKFCCDTACTGACKTCSATSKEGQCTDEMLGFPDAACPAATPVCQTGVCVADQGKKHLGEPCMGNAQCFSNNCRGMPAVCL